MRKSKTRYLSHGFSLNKYSWNTYHVPGTVWAREAKTDRPQVPALLGHTALTGANEEGTFPTPEPYTYSIPNFNSLEVLIKNLKKKNQTMRNEGDTCTFLISRVVQNFIFAP